MLHSRPNKLYFQDLSMRNTFDLSAVSVRTEEESSGQEPKKLSEEERELLNEIESLSLIGH